MKSPSITPTSAEKILTVLQRVPQGKVVSYGQVADLAGLPGRARLVGKVLKGTPKGIKIPWYRVVRSNGELAFSILSEQANYQKQRLHQENVKVLKNRVNMKIFQWKPSLAELLTLGF